MAHSERRFRASPPEVYEALIDAERYPQWLVGAKWVRVDDQRWPARGSEFRHEVGVGPAAVSDVTTVEDAEFAHHLDLLVRARPFLVAAAHFRLVPDGGGTLVVLDETPRGAYRLLAPLISPLVRWRNDRSLARLAQLIDGDE
jgi:uncharacterized protein YndB with AHSA1/START domain